MTNTNEKLRSLFLAALMVISVFGGTVALSGNAAAANAPAAYSLVLVGTPI
ncbi:surface glycoprotein [Halomicroarcula sp. GCM10025709]|uniref:surface glycoprotein n=1 Tax=Halomicroarcula sp. GCM10025709 TaxID=3252669 RepID=UPI00360D3D3B